jgi:hypothetical protein
MAPWKTVHFLEEARNKDARHDAVVALSGAADLVA